MNDIYPSFFKTFTKISKKIHTGKSVSDILTCIVEDLAGLLNAKGCIYWLLDREKKEITAKVFHGFDYQSLSLVDYERLVTIFPVDAGTVYIPDARNDERLPDYERLGKRRVGSVTAMLFQIVPPFRGILAVYFFSTGKKLDNTQMELVSALGEQGALALQKTIGFDERLFKVVGQIIESFALAIEAKDPVTHGHSLRVARLSAITAEQLGLKRTGIEAVEQAALLHDIGKIGMEDTVLENLGNLSAAQLSKIRQHPVLGAKILSPLSIFSKIAPMVKSHHELYDGTGYPEGLKGDRIPLGARILTVCDAFETMTSGRPNLAPLTMKEALAALENGAGLRFDPDITAAFVSALRDHPGVLDGLGSAESSLARLKEKISKIIDANRIRSKLTNRIPTSF